MKVKNILALTMATAMCLGVTSPASAASQKPKKAPVVLAGVVVSKNKNSVSVLTSSLKVSGKTKAQSKVVVDLGKFPKIAKTLAVGNSLTLSANGHIQSNKLTVDDHPKVSENKKTGRVRLAIVRNIDLTNHVLVIQPLRSADDNAPKDVPGKDNEDHKAVTVDITSAILTPTSGGPAEWSGLVNGQLIALSGFGKDHVLTAKQVFTFPAQIQAFRGFVDSITGTVLTINGESTRTVDLALNPNALIMRKGEVVDSSTIALDERILVLGNPNEAGEFVVTAAFLFKGEKHDHSSDDGDNHGDDHGGSDDDPTPPAPPTGG